jgi:hypothetical protein
LFPHTAINLFNDVESAVTWLRQTAPEPQQTGCTLPCRSHADELKLRAIVTAFARRLGVTPPA